MAKSSRWMSRCRPRTISPGKSFTFGRGSPVQMGRSPGRNRCSPKQSESEGSCSPQLLRRRQRVAGAKAALERLCHLPQMLKEEINHRRSEEGQDLREDQTANDGDTERPAQFRPSPETDG